MGTPLYLQPEHHLHVWVGTRPEGIVGNGMLEVDTLHIITW